MSKIFLIIIFIYLLQIVQLNRVHNVNFKRVYLPSKSFVTINQEDYYGLSKEYSSLSKIFDYYSTKIDETRLNSIKKLSNILGVLPEFEQIAFALAAKTATNTSSNYLFDSSTYLNYMIRTDANGFEMELSSLKKLIDKKAIRMGASLGCLKSASSKFGFNSFEDNHVTKLMLQKIENIMNNINSLATSEKEFAEALNKYSKGQREYLLKLNYDLSNADNYLVSTDNQKYIIKRNKPQVETLYSAFNTFYTKTQSYFKNIQTQTNECIMLVGNFKGCINEQSANDDAGKSSDYYKNSKVIYKNNKIIGVNGAHGIRPDNRTQNNFSLQHGFGFGRNYVPINNKNEVKINNMYSPDWIDKISACLSFESDLFDNYINTTKFNDTDMKTTWSKIIDNFTTFNKDPSTSSIEFKKSIDYSNTENTKGYYKLFLGGESNKDYYCNITDNYIIDTEYKLKILKKFENGKWIYSHEDISNNINSTDNNALLICQLGKKYMIITNSNHDIIDFLENGKSIVSAKEDIIQGCFAAYSSGGKNDKDSCRGTLINKCGIALDHQCKLSGLYDFMNEIPVSDNSLPLICQSDSEKCFMNFIDKYFIKEGIIPKGSMFFSYGLIGQMESSHNFKNLNEVELQMSNTDFDEIIDNQINKFYSENTKNYNYDKKFELSKSLLLSEVDKTYSILYDGSSLIKNRLIMTLIILFVLL